MNPLPIDHAFFSELTPHHQARLRQLPRLEKSASQHHHRK